MGQQIPSIKTPPARLLNQQYLDPHLIINRGTHRSHSRMHPLTSIGGISPIYLFIISAMSDRLTFAEFVNIIGSTHPPTHTQQIKCRTLLIARPENRQSGPEEEEEEEIGAITYRSEVVITDRDVRWRRMAPSFPSLTLPFDCVRDETREFHGGGSPLRIMISVLHWSG